MKAVLNAAREGTAKAGEQLDHAAAATTTSAGSKPPRVEDLPIPLPRDLRTWDESDIGPPERWPETLQASIYTIASFNYPAGVFWGDELALLHNHSWAKVSNDEQGRKQRGRLSPDAWQSLTAALKGGMPRRIDARQLMRCETDGITQYTVLCSPLFSDATGSESNVIGLLTQVLPKSYVRDYEGRARSVASDRSQQGSERSQRGADFPLRGADTHVLDTSQLGTAVDAVALDEHPFFHRFAEMLPTGLAILDHRAQAVFVNQHFYQLTTHLDTDQSFKSWPQSIHPDDYERVMGAYQEAFNSQRQLRIEFRAQGVAHPWRLLLLTPLGDENLEHVSLRDYGGFICSVVDISSEKSAELNERKTAHEATERKEHQERFIDMISHELRNPLSAILHCTDDIEECVMSRDAEIDRSLIREAVETINLCITHQRNIVDDVLNFSKLDASMLSLAPRPYQPSRQLANSLKMFQPEFRKQGMKFEYCIDTSYVDFDILWVMADLPRIGQVLVNLVTNAIKFTVRKPGEKKVTVSVGASRERPTSYPPNVVYFNSEDTAFRMDATNSGEWGPGKVLYLMIAVKDTGIGISEEGQRKLFERFRQATPKTGGDYGGSGLGLNISRKLCHLHGGEIGVSSQEGSGSTFGFFVKMKRTNPPNQSASNQRNDEELDDKKFRENIENNDGMSPDHMDPADVPQSLNNRPVKNTQDATPEATGSSRYEETANIASGVQETAADHYGNAGRPAISKTHKSGERIQYADVARRAPESQKLFPERPKHSPRRGPDTAIHVLLVEDNIINQRIVFRKLESKGFNVTTANNGREAISAVRASPRPSSGDKAAFDVVLMDQEMPVMDGNAATSEMRTLEREGVLERVPVLGVTANVREEQQRDMRESGMDDVISKPYKIDELCEKLKKITSEAREAKVMKGEKE